MGLPELPSLEEVREAMYMPRSKFRELAEETLAQSDVFERALKSDVYRQLWGGKKFSKDLDELMQMPVLTSDFYARYGERDPRIPAGPVKSGDDSWLCSTGSKRMKYYPYSDYDARKLGLYGGRYNLTAGFPKEGVVVNVGAEPPHCSLTMVEWSSKAYGIETIPLIRGMKPEIIMEKMMERPDKLVGVIGVPLVTLRFINSVVEKYGKPWDQLFPNAKKTISGAEALNGQQKNAFKKMGIEPYELYASAELWIPSIECHLHKGPHLFCDDNIYYVKTDDDVKYIWDCKNGDIGELFATTPNREAFPLVNFATGDIVEIKETGCPCGITHPTINVIARTDNVLNIGGAKAYEHHIEEKFYEVGELHPIPNWQIHWSRENSGGVGYHRFDVLIDNDMLDNGAVKDALLQSFARDERTEQLLQAYEAGILSIEIQPLAHKDFESRIQTARHKRVRIVKKF
jgi:phenylacetate-coenzyme A ligase PaaK-like adenylate-forming protein